MFRSIKRIILFLGMDPVIFRTHIFISIYTNGIGYIGNVEQKDVLAFQDLISAYGSPQKYDTSIKKKKYAKIWLF
jgi:hypothetical protein